LSGDTTAVVEVEEDLGRKDVVVLFSLRMGYAKYSLATKGSPDPISAESSVLLLTPPMMDASSMDSMFTMGNRAGMSLEADEFCLVEEEEAMSVSL
jgi:hypothetical protein